MIQQLSLFDWHSTEELPPTSGFYTVKDRMGRVFITWFEKTIRGFNHVFEGVGYTITAWRYI